MYVPTCQEGLNLLKLCQIRLDIKSQVTCGHCRFRKTFFILKAIARKKISSKETREKQISDILQVNSDAIVRFCIKRIEERWGDNCVSEHLIQKLDAESNDFERLRNKTNPVSSSQVIQPLRAQEKPKEHTFSLTFTDFCEIDKTQMNRLLKGLDEMSHDRRLDCFIRSPPNVNAKEWLFDYA